MAIEILCKQCGKSFITFPSRPAKFCGRPCYEQSKIGKTAWNKGLKGWMTEEHHASLVKGTIKRNTRHPLSSEQARINGMKAIAPAGEKHYRWKGGKKPTQRGYIYALAPTHPRQHNGYVFEHILVMEKHIGRYLTKGEIIHHLNGDKKDNRIENLHLCTHKEHAKFHPR